MERSIESLDPKRTAQEKDIDTNILKQNSVFFAFHVQKDINASISSSKFPKETEGIPVYKKKSKLSKENYRSISILPKICKVYERCLMNKYQNILKLNFPNFSEMFEGDIVHSTAY